MAQELQHLYFHPILLFGGCTKTIRALYGNVGLLVNHKWLHQLQEICNSGKGQ